VLVEGLPTAASKLPLVKALLEAKADVNAQDEDPENDLDNFTSTTYSGLEQRQHRTALHYGAMIGEMGLCAQLLSAKARVDIEDRFKMTALDVAVEEGHVMVADVLLRGKADPNRGNMQRGLQQTIVHQVANEGNVKLLQLLLKHGGKANAVGKQGLTPLHLAARKKQAEIVKVLVEAGADIGQTDSSGKTAGQYAMIGKDQSSVIGKALALDDSLQISDRVALLESANTKKQELFID
jgi:ankyrin repeat protein